MFQTRQISSARSSDSICALIASGIIAFVSAVYVEFFHEAAVLARRGSASGILFGTPTFSSFWHIALLTCTFILLLFILNRSNYKTTKFIVRHRILIGIIIIIIFTTFEISGSSVAQWSNFLGGESFQGTLAGIPRSMRSDEWAVFTPFAFSQSSTGYAAASDVLRAAPTDVTMVYAQPSWALATVFRPFLWGFLFLGSTRGLAFFWSARLICLVLVSYQLGLRITHKNTWLAMTYAALVAFAPIVQWWFAVNGIAELFIAGQGLVLVLDQYLHESSYLRRWRWGLLLAYLIGVYALVLYPAWQIGLFYVFAGMGLWIVLDWKTELNGNENKKNNGTDLRMLFSQRILPLIIPVFAMVVLLGIIIYQSWDAVRIVMATSYPGARLETGGGMGQTLFNGGASLFSALNDSEILPNAPEQATFFSLFPAGLVLSVVSLRRTRDHMVIPLLAIDAFLLAYGIFGFPTWLSTVTLLSKIPSSRLKLSTSYVDVLLLIRTLSLFVMKSSPEAKGVRGISKKNFSLSKTILAICGSFAVVFFTATFSTYHIKYMFLILLFVVVSISFVGIYLIMAGSRVGYSCLSSAVIFVVVAGLCVNPIQHGASALTDNAVVQLATETLDQSDVVLTDNPFVGQALIASGIPSITSVNTYPDLSRWASVDPDGTYRDIYNRYAYVEVQLQTSGNTWFEEKQSDYVVVHLYVGDLPKIGATHYISTLDMTKYSTDDVEFVPLSSSGDWTLYEIKSE